MTKSKHIRSYAALLAAACLLFSLLSFASCSSAGNNNSTTTASESPQESSVTEESTSAILPAIWENATYKEDQTFGSGAKTITVEISADGYSVTFTLKTDAENLGAALVENDLVAGETSQYGLYIKTANGMLADYDVDQTYWSLSKDGTALMTGADSTPIADGEHYEVTRTK